MMPIWLVGLIIGMVLVLGLFVGLVIGIVLGICTGAIYMAGKKKEGEKDDQKKEV